MFLFIHLFIFLSYLKIDSWYPPWLGFICLAIYRCVKKCRTQEAVNVQDGQQNGNGQTSGEKSFKESQIC